MGNSSKYYFPQLDAIRGVSFLAIYFVHGFHPDFGKGFVPELLQYVYNNLTLFLDVFFIFSAFLLTWLGINEYKQKGNFSFVNYFIRRALRIWPLYILLMVFSFIVVPYAAAYFHVSVTLPPAWYYIFFVSNFYLEGHVYFLRFLWTLSVEEQFYLFWGLCLLFFQKRIMVCVLIMCAASMTYAIYAALKGADTYYHTLMHLFDFAAGILAALWLHEEKPVINFFRKMSAAGSALFLALLPVVFIVVFSIDYYCSIGVWGDILLHYLFVIYTGFFIIDQMVNEKAILKLKTQQFLIYTGKISYGLYCFHGIILTFGALILQKMQLSIPYFLQAIIFLVCNYIVAAISYQFIEKPFLTLKNKLRRV